MKRTVQDNNFRAIFWRVFLLVYLVIFIIGILFLVGKV